MVSSTIHSPIRGIRAHWSSDLSRAGTGNIPEKHPAVLESKKELKNHHNCGGGGERIQESTD